MNQNQPSSEVLTVNEIAGYLRVSETTVWRWCNSGKLPAFRIGRSWRIRRTDLEQHIKHGVSASNEFDAACSVRHMALLLLLFVFRSQSDKRINRKI